MSASLDLALASFTLPQANLLPAPLRLIQHCRMVPPSRTHCTSCSAWPVCARRPSQGPSPQPWTSWVHAHRPASASHGLLLVIRQH